MKAWEPLRGGEGALDMDEPQDLYCYLGCKHDRSTMLSKDGTPVTLIEYSMESFLDSGLQAYGDLAGGW